MAESISGQTLTIITATEPQDARSSTRSGQERVRKLVQEGIPVETLQQNFSNFLLSLRQILSADDGRVGSLVLDEITFNVEIGLDGEFKLLGSGLAASTSSSLTFTLRREAILGQRPSE